MKVNLISSGLINKDIHPQPDQPASASSSHAQALHMQQKLTNMNQDPDVTTLSDPALLERIDRLRDLNIGQHVPLPQVSADVSFATLVFCPNMLFSLLWWATKARENLLCLKA